MSKRTTPPRQINFSPKPTSPTTRKDGRVLQMRVKDVKDAPVAPSLTDTPVAYSVDADGPLVGSDDVTGGDTPPNTPAPSQRDEATDGETLASQVGVQTLITNAVSGWCAVIYERAVYSLRIAPLGGGVFEVYATLALPSQPGMESEDPRDQLSLRVSCWLGRSKLVRTEVEPLSPGGR